MTCMRSPSLSSQSIKAVIEKYSLTFNALAENKTYMSSPALRRLKGQVAGVPILIGSNSQEGRVFVQNQTDVLKYALQTFGNDTDMA